MVTGENVGWLAAKRRWPRARYRLKSNSDRFLEQMFHQLLRSSPSLKTKEDWRSPPELISQALNQGVSPIA
jgi:hypothetical protein